MAAQGAAVSARALPACNLTDHVLKALNQTIHAQTTGEVEAKRKITGQGTEPWLTALRLVEIQQR